MHTTDARDPSTGDNTEVTLINTVEIPADEIDKFMADWRKRADIMSTLPGFLDYTLHRALTDDTRFQLVNVAHWDSQEAFEAALTHPEFAALRQAARDDMDFDVEANPALYTVVASDRRQRELPPCVHTDAADDAGT
jgi:heme oxygenase (mycobilin-producing)